MFISKNKLGTENLKENINNEVYTKIRDRFMQQMEELEKRGPTAQLWVQYLNMIGIVQNFIEAERSGD